jgi:ABC-type Fe3+ transport system substrate-binding protein
VQMVSGAALAQMVASGQVAPSPTIFSSNVHVLQGKGEPIAWQPLPPVVVNTTFSAVLAQAPHPAAALLFYDYLHSRAGQQVVLKGGLNSGRTDLTAASASYATTNPQDEYPQTTYLKKYKQWEQIMNHDFMGR